MGINEFMSEIPGFEILEMSISSKACKIQPTTVAADLKWRHIQFKSADTYGDFPAC